MGEIILTSTFYSFQVKDAMESYISRRAEHTSKRAYFTLKEDLITAAKQKAYERGANALIEAKLSITKGNYFCSYSQNELLFNL